MIFPNTIIYLVIISFMKCDPRVEWPSSGPHWEETKCKQTNLTSQKCQSIQRVLTGLHGVSLTLLAFRATFPRPLLPLIPSIKGCFVVLQSVCLNGSLENISTGNEADAIL